MGQRVKGGRDYATFPQLILPPNSIFLSISVLRHTFWEMLARSNAILENGLSKSPEVKWLGQALNVLIAKQKYSTLPLSPPSPSLLQGTFIALLLIYLFLLQVEPKGNALLNPILEIMQHYLLMLCNNFSKMWFPLSGREWREQLTLGGGWLEFRFTPTVSFHHTSHICHY